jgi:hypothetical protein
MDDEFLALLAQFSIEETRGLTAGDLDLQLAVRFQREDLKHYRRERRREDRHTSRNYLDGLNSTNESIANILGSFQTTSQTGNQATNESFFVGNDNNADNESNRSSDTRRDSMGDVEMRQECSICGDEAIIANGIALPCGHFFCFALE